MKDKPQETALVPTVVQGTLVPSAPAEAEWVQLDKAIKIRATPEEIARYLVDNDPTLILKNPVTRLIYYNEMCRRYNVDPWTKPFDLIEDKKTGKITFYRNQEFAAQRRKASGISCSILEHGVMDGVYFIRLKGWTQEGRQDEDIGSCAWLDSMGRPLNPADKADGMKKAITGAKRRLTLSLEGCSTDDRGGFLEVEDAEPRQTSPRVLAPPTRVKPALKPAEPTPEAQPAPTGSQGASEAIPAEVPAEPKQATVAAEPQPSKPSVQQPGPPAPPTPAPKVQVVGKRAVYIPGR